MLLLPRLTAPLSPPRLVKGFRDLPICPRAASRGGLSSPENRVGFRGRAGDGLKQKLPLLLRAGPEVAS